MPGVSELFTWEAGAGPRALCLHGSGSSGEGMFLNLADGFPDFHIVAPDRPNHGRSPDAEPTSLESEVMLLGEFLEEPAHLFGQSYGGVLCLLLAARWPDKVLSLAVNEPPAFQLGYHEVRIDLKAPRLWRV